MEDRLIAESMPEEESDCTMCTWPFQGVPGAPRGPRGATGPPGAQPGKRCELVNLPIDGTFVDEYDNVRCYTQGRHRISPRSPTVIGRKAQNCHPPDSVYLVERILEEFKAGTRDEAEFWLKKDGRFVHIRYFAVCQCWSLPVSHGGHPGHNPYPRPGRRKTSTGLVNWLS